MTSSWRNGILAGTLLLMAGLMPATATAQQADARWNALYDRIIRLEHELRTLKRSYEARIRRLEEQLRSARGKAGTRHAGAARPATSATRSAAPASDAGKVFAPLPPLREPQVSIEIDDGNTRQEQLLGRLRSDNPPAGSVTTAAPPAGAAGTAPAASTRGPIPLPGAITDALGATPAAPSAGSGGSLAPGQVAVAPLPPPAGAAPAGTPPSAPVSIPPALAGLSASALLQRARQNFLARRYDKAEQAYRAWLARFANRPEAADARFELGETLYVQGRFKEAGKLFVDAYKAAANGPVAPRALLRLGQVLKRMGRRKEACKAFSTLRRRHADSRAARLQAPLEMKRLKCKG